MMTNEVVLSTYVAISDDVRNLSNDLKSKKPSFKTESILCEYIDKGN